ncbi:16S rRNA (guanine(966)-N(2))-methyltransferase RsmD [Azorhizophilus paspali]|uniref:Ribosomal RNA small subunit methyltransferase D n=1 Tax=Azorhizophilus paspali TaxID=69963 RepID=A0ABV6SP91_AZOPA
MRQPSRPSRPAARPHGGQGQLRIIGGEWRSRRFAFPEAPGLRPTPDRVRETLFNWLAPYIEGARVLDPFAGSGALYLEALSRGAAQALALDLDGQAVASLRRHLDSLRCGNGQLLQGDALRYLEYQATSPFDLVFLDPPFHQNLLEPACRLLEERGWLARDAWIYTESEVPPSGLGLPGNWHLHREKQAGQVHYALWQRTG